MANRVCEKCIHYDVCLLHEDNFIDDVSKNGFCGKFKNKADFVEAVRCKDCVYRYQYEEFDRDTQESYVCYGCRLLKKDFGDNGYCPLGKKEIKERF